MPKRQELDRIIVGNQIAMMRVLQALAPPAWARDLEIRCHDIKDWWHHNYGEEVGFSVELGDKPRAIAAHKGE